MASGQGKLVGRNETTKFLSPNGQHRENKRQARASLAQTKRSCLASSVSEWFPCPA